MSTKDLLVIRLSTMYELFSNEQKGGGAGSVKRGDAGIGNFIRKKCIFLQYTELRFGLALRRFFSYAFLLFSVVNVGVRKNV